MLESDITLERGWEIAREMVSEHGMYCTLILSSSGVEAYFQLGGRSWSAGAPADRPGNAIATAALLAAGVIDLE